MPKLSTTRFGYSFTHLHTVIVLQQVLRFTKSFRGRSYSRCYSRYSVNHQYVTVHLAVDCRKSCRTCCDKSCSRKCSRYHSRYCSRCRCRSCGRCHIRSYCGMLLWYVTAAMSLGVEFCTALFARFALVVFLSYHVVGCGARPSRSSSSRRAPPSASSPSSPSTRRSDSLRPRWVS